MVAVATDETALRLEAAYMANFAQRQFGVVVYQVAGTTDADTLQRCSVQAATASAT